MQCAKERAGLDVKCAAGDLLDAARDSQTVHLAGDQDQQAQGALQKTGLLRAQRLPPIGVL
jgi:hypothetical protein